MSISNKYDLIIFGSGMTGLSSAYYFKKKYPKKKVLIIEKESEVGGLASNISFGKIKLEKFYHHWYERDKDIFREEYIADLAYNISFYGINISHIPSQLSVIYLIISFLVKISFSYRYL